VNIRGSECWVGVEFDTLLDATVSVPLSHGFGVSFEANTTSAFGLINWCRTRWRPIRAG